MRNLIFSMVLVAALSGAALAQSQALTPRAKASAEAFINAVETLEIGMRSMPPAKDLDEELKRRIEIDQAIRGVEWRAALPVEEWRAANEAVILPKMRQIDADNSAFLKSKLPPDGWFRISRDGAAVAANAFLIVQHSADRAWQYEVLLRMEPLLNAREVSPQAYALLYDRVHLFRDGKQRFGTQATCRDGKVVFDTMDEPDKVQERRDAIGFSRPLHSEYGKMVGIGQEC